MSGTVPRGPQSRRILTHGLWTFIGRLRTSYAGIGCGGLERHSHELISGIRASVYRTACAGVLFALIERQRAGITFKKRFPCPSDLEVLLCDMASCC